MLLYMSVAAGLFILPCALLRRRWMRRLPPTLLPWIWLPAIARLLLPGQLPLLPAMHAASALPSAPTQIIAGAGLAGFAEEAAAGLANAQAQAARAGASALPLLGGIWLAGCLIVSAVLIAQWIGWRVRLLGATPGDNMAMPFSTRRRVRILVSDRIDAPIATGLARPRIYLPAQMPAESLRHVLMHEGVHIKRYHAAIKLLLVILRCVHWFNPLVWAMAYLVDRDLELSCDARALAALHTNNSVDYARTLISLAARRSSAPALASAFAKHPVEERIVMIMKPTRHTRLSLLALALLLPLCVCMFAGAETALPEAFALKRIESFPEIGAGDSQLLAVSTGVTALQARAMFAARGAALLLPGKLDGFTPVGDSLTMMLAETPADAAALLQLPLEPEGAADAGEPQALVEASESLPQAMVEEIFTAVTLTYENEAGESIAFRAEPAMLSEKWPPSSGAYRWIARLDNALILVQERNIGGSNPVHRLIAVPEDDFLAYRRGEAGELTVIYTLLSQTVDTNRMMDLLKGLSL